MASPVQRNEAAGLNENLSAYSELDHKQDDSVRIDRNRLLTTGKRGDPHLGRGAIGRYSEGPQKALGRSSEGHPTAPQPTFYRDSHAGTDGRPSWEGARELCLGPGVCEFGLPLAQSLGLDQLYRPSPRSPSLGGYCEQPAYFPLKKPISLTFLQQLARSFPATPDVSSSVLRSLVPNVSLPATTSHLMATLSPVRPIQRMDRPRTAPPRTGSGSILRTSSLLDLASNTPSASPRSPPSNISFAPLPEIGPRKRRNNRPLGVAARSSILHRQRGNLVKHSDPNTEGEYQQQQQPPPFDISGDAPQVWSSMDDPQLALQMAMAEAGPEPSNTECPTIVYVENSEPQQPDALQVTISVSTPKRNRSRKGSTSKVPNKLKSPKEWGSDEGALHELRKMGTKDKDGNDAGGLKFWRRLAKRNSTPILPVVKTPNDQMPALPITATIPTTGSNLFSHRSGKQSDYTDPLVIERIPSDMTADVVSPSIVISPVETLEPSLTQSVSSTAASSSPPTPEMQIQSVSPIVTSDSYDSVPTPRSLAADGAEEDGKMGALLPIELVETKRHSDELYSQYERVPFGLTSTASL